MRPVLSTGPFWNAVKGFWSDSFLRQIHLVECTLCVIDHASHPLVQNQLAAEFIEESVQC